MCLDCIEKARKHSAEGGVHQDDDIEEVIEDLSASVEETAVHDIVDLLEQMAIMENLPVPPQPPVTPAPPLPDPYVDALKKTLHEFYHVKKQIPTNKMLWRSLRKTVNYKGSVKDLRKMLQQSGYRVQLHNKKTRRSRAQSNCCCTVSFPQVTRVEDEVD